MYKTPGVFIFEPPSFPPSVVPVDTAIPAFIGFTEKSPNPASEPLKPVKIFDLDEFVTLFGRINHAADFSYTIDVTLDSGSVVLPESVNITQSVIAPTSVYRYNLYHAIRLYFSNGGGPCYIVSVGLHSAGTGKPFTPHANPSGGSYSWEDAVAVVDNEDDPTLFVIPELVHTINGGSSDYENTYNAALMQSLTRKDRFVIIDVPQRRTGGTTQTNVSNDMDDFRMNYSSNFDLDARKFGGAYYPNLETAIDAAALSTDANGNIQIAVTVNETVIDITDPANPVSVTSPNAAFTILNDLKGDNNYDGVYQQIVKELRNLPFIIPPSPAVAGVYAKVDSQRGVFKAPANVTVASVIRATAKIDDSLQAGMNVNPSGKSVNPIRTISNRGMVVWGARTLDANNLDFRYINVRRFFNFVEESVKKAMYRFVFEPNTANTWTPVRAAIENFLTTQWEAGALQGAKADDAFFVEVGLGQTMSPNDILEGNLKVRIGMAVSRPAEFIILEFIQVLPKS